MSAIRGIYPALPTPFTANKRVDLQGLKNNAQWLAQEGVHGLIVLGSTGEFASLDEVERREAIEAVVSGAGRKAPVMAGASAETTERAITNARVAKEAGAASLLILPPWYYTPDQEEIYEHYRRISDAVDLPIMVYNNPWSSKVDISAETVARLAELANVKAIKESTGDIRRITDIRIRTNDGMTIFCGYEDMVFESFILGATGFVNMIANFEPRATVELFNLVVEKKDYTAGWKLYKRMLPLLRLLETPGIGQRIVKHVQDGMGLAGGYSASPKLPLSADIQAKINDLVSQFRQS